jgi:hypothetical protein
MTRALARIALVLYPLAFRRRYGAEMRAVLEQTPARAATVLDLGRGAIAAHLRPPVGVARSIGIDERLRGSVSAILACWVAFAAAGVGFAVTTEDAPFGKAAERHALLGGTHAAVQLLAIVASLAVLGGALPLVVLALRRAVREPNARLITSLTVAAVVGFAVLTGVLAWFSSYQHAHGASTIGGIAFIAWGVAGLCCGAVCVGAARRTLFAMPVARHWLLAAFACGAVITAAMVGISLAASLYAAFLAVDAPGLAAAPNGPLQLTSVSLSLAPLTIVMIVAAALAVTTTARGWRAISS